MTPLGRKKPSGELKRISQMSSVRPLKKTRKMGPKQFRKLVFFMLLAQGGSLIVSVVEGADLFSETWTIYPHYQVWSDSWSMASNPALIRPTDSLGQLHAALMVSGVLDRAYFGGFMLLLMVVVWMLSRLRLEIWSLEDKLRLMDSSAAGDASDTEKSDGDGAPPEDKDKNKD